MLPCCIGWGRWHPVGFGLSFPVQPPTLITAIYDTDSRCAQVCLAPQNTTCDLFLEK